MADKPIRWSHANLLSVIRDIEELVLHWLEGQAACSGNPAGDINKDCRVDFLDFAIIASRRLESTKY
jgi:hypothetical protein